VGNLCAPPALVTGTATNDVRENHDLLRRVDEATADQSSRLTSDQLTGATVRVAVCPRRREPHRWRSVKELAILRPLCMEVEARMNRA
jgi:hypothetical protein